jgi:hypothetical protein
MASESIKILIEAEDKASMQVASASKNIEQSVKGVKETGQKAKASVEFFGVLAGQLGGSQLQSAAGGVAAITEKMGQFSEMMKVGGAGAMAFQAGLTLLVTTMSFKLGQSIGEMIFGVRDSEKAFSEAKAEADAYAAALVAAGNQKFSEQLEDIQLIRDPEAKQQAAVDLFRAIEKGINNSIESMNFYQTQVDEMDASMIPDPFGDQTEIRNQLQQQANAQADIHASLQKQLQTVSKQFGARAQLVQTIKNQQAAEDAAAAKAAQSFNAGMTTLKQLGFQYDELTKGRDAARAAQLRDQGIGDADIKAILMMDGMIAKEKELQAVKDKARQAEESRLSQVENLAKSELQRLEEQKVALEQGQQAAHAFRLTQQGMDKESAEAIAAAQAAMDASTKAAGQKVQPAAALQATESRLMIRGPKEDSQKKIEQNTQVTAEQSKLMNAAIDKLKDAVEKTQGQRLVLEGTRA